MWTFEFSHVHSFSQYLNYNSYNYIPTGKITLLIMYQHRVPEQNAFITHKSLNLSYISITTQQQVKMCSDAERNWYQTSITHKVIGPSHCIKPSGMCASLCSKCSPIYLVQSSIFTKFPMFNAFILCLCVKWSIGSMFSPFS